MARMSRTKPPPKSKEHKQLQESRRSQAPKRNQRVEYPVPLPPISHVQEDGSLHEQIVPTGDEEWRPAKVLKLEHHERTVSPDDHGAVIQPLDEKGKPLGPDISLSVVFLREPE